MSGLSRRARAVVAAACLVAGAGAAQAAPASRVVTLGGDVTEIAFALGQSARIACVDQTSLYPQAATRLPQVGYLRALGAEGVLSCRPDLIVASAEAGPPAALAQLRATGVPIVTVPSDHVAAAVARKITAVAAAFGVPAEGEALRRRFADALARAQRKAGQAAGRPRVIFLMGRGPAGLMVAGRDTAADAMIALAQGENAASGFSGYKPLTREAALTLRPDIILVADFAARAAGGVAALRGRPEFAQTPAAAHGRILAVDTMLLLGFGPRLPEALEMLGTMLHGA